MKAGNDSLVATRADSIGLYGFGGKTQKLALNTRNRRPFTGAGE